MWKIKIKFLISLILLINFILVVISGVGLYLAPSGKIARTTNWNFLGVSKDNLKKYHTYTGFFLAILVLIHFLLNFNIFTTEGKNILK